MKMTALLGGLTIKNKSYYDKANDDNLHLWDGTEISFEGDENDGPNDCYNYADWSALCDTGFFEDKSVNAETLYLEKCEYGFRINGYFVPCYSVQNGYYTNQITIIAIKDGEEIARIETECEG